MSIYQDRMFIQKINQTLSGRPFNIQAAVNREWEKAWKIPLDHSDFVYNLEEIEKFAKGKGSVVGIELFYKTKEKMDFYLGVQYHPGLKGVQNPIEFITRYFQILAELESRTFDSLLPHLGEALNRDPETFLRQPPTSVVLGVVDWWLTFGPCEVWGRGEAWEMTLDQLKRKLEGHEGLISNNKNYTGLEFVYDTLPRHWLSFQASEKIGEIFQLNYSRALNLLSEYLDFAV